MLKKFMVICALLGFTISISGCVALLAGAGGTALWQGGKVISEENTTLTKAIAATKSSFQAKKITLTDQVTKNAVAQLRGENQAGAKVAVDLIQKGDKNVRIEIRIGIGQEQPARELLNAIKKRL